MNISRLFTARSTGSSAVGYQPGGRRSAATRVRDGRAAAAACTRARWPASGRATMPSGASGASGAALPGVDGRDEILSGPAVA